MKRLLLPALLVFALAYPSAAGVMEADGSPSAAPSPSPTPTPEAQTQSAPSGYSDALLDALLSALTAIPALL